MNNRHKQHLVNTINAAVDQYARQSHVTRDTAAQTALLAAISVTLRHNERSSARRIVRRW